MGNMDLLVRFIGLVEGSCDGVGYWFVEWDIVILYWIKEFVLFFIFLVF